MSAQAGLDFTRTAGPAYDAELDQKRLSLQHERIKALMMDGRWRTLAEIESATGFGQASISSQLRHLRKPRFGGYEVELARQGDSGTWAYRVLPGVTCSNPTKRSAAQERIRQLAERNEQLERENAELRARLEGLQ